MAAKDLHAEIKDIVEKDLSRKDGEGIFINEKIMNKCWYEIWKWINVSSIGPLLLKYGVATDVTDLQYINNSYYTPRQKADYLLQLAAQGGPNGYHILYMCIRDDDENPLGHGSAVDCLIETAKQLKTVKQQHFELTTALIKNDVQTEDDIPGGQTTPRTTLSPQPLARPDNVLYPYQETHQQYSSITSTTNRTLYKSDCENLSIPLQLPKQTSTSPPRHCNSFPPRLFNSSMGHSTSDPYTDPVSSASTASDIFPCQTPIRSTSTSSEDILLVVDCLLNDLSEERISKSGLDIQMLGADDLDDFEELVDELIKFIVSCLNNRESGAMIVGIDCSTVGQYKLTGIQFQYERLSEKLWPCLKKAIAERVFIRDCTERVEKINVVNSVERMIRLKLHEVNDDCIRNIGNIVLMTVVPDWNLCQDFVYVVIEERKRVVYCRINGHTAQLKGPQLSKVQQQIHKDNEKFTS